MLEKGREAALGLHARVAADGRFAAGLAPELDIVVWSPRAATASASSAIARRIFEGAARRGLHLALAELPARFTDPGGTAFGRDRETATCLRSVLMKPEHLEWLEPIGRILDEAAGEAFRESTAR
jgi:hypothetical protein